MEATGLTAGARSQRLSAWLWAAVVLLGGWFLPPLAAWHAEPLLLNFGPNDAEYASGLREDWERDGPTIFHWTGTRARFELPLHVVGSGNFLRLRARRHFVEPAHVRLAIEGQTADTFELSAQSTRSPERPYLVRETALPVLDGRHTFTVDLEAPSSNPRPLGVALDWLELQAGQAGGFRLTLGTRVRIVVALAATLALLAAAGAGSSCAALAAGVLLAALAFGLHGDVLAVERILRLGLPCFLLTGATCVAACRMAGWHRVVLRGSLSVAGVLTMLVLAALAVRLSLLLHPQFFYPDVRVHALFARELAKGGLGAFLDGFTANQYRFSLGLQQENGHWYAFPYPPLFYAVAWPLIRFLRYAPEVAVSLIPAALNSLEVLLVYALGQRLFGQTGRAVAAAAALPLLPIFVVRLSLAYFPALVGHFVDVVLLCYLAYRWQDMHRRRTWIGLGLLLALALLSYTQALLNFAWILPVFLVLRAWRDRTPEDRRRQLGLLAAGILGVLLSLVFYGRYVRFLVDMRNGVAMPEESILLEKQARAVQQPPEAADDPFAGPTLDPLRGLKKAAWRLYVFYGWFAPLILAAGCWMFRGLNPTHQHLLIAWASVYLVLNLASGGLPGPNLVRYNKDLEIVAPLVCLALGSAWDLMHRVHAAQGAVGAAAYLAFAGNRALTALTSRFFVDRSSGL